ncbi:ABC-type nitrate/sulfonate/bicarbonate transport system, permease component [gamma proteobacterium HTCC5015]|nr:ABC-type nitrate/sulfonate/bicarbonate transport system, permease component [gamma proteobacterium HTCC5015]
MVTKVANKLEMTPAAFLAPLLRLMAWENPKQQLSSMFNSAGLPLMAFLLFLGLWSAAASRIETSLGNVPGPVQVWEEAGNLWKEHRRGREKAEVFYQRQRELNERILASDPDAEVRIRDYTGQPTFVDQIFTSLYTVFTGFLLAALISIPLGILCGLSEKVNSALNPLIQVFKPVSPLAWLPIVTMVVSAVYVSDDPMLEKSFLTSAITVTLCSLWPALINTTVGVSSISEDLINVSRVLRLKWYTKIYKVVLPAAMPMMFTGLRLSLGVGWMVLIAAEMLAQNPGLGKFVWDEFQNGSSSSLGRIMVAVFTIGFIGFLLDRVMLILQRFFSYDDGAAIR